MSSKEPVFTFAADEKVLCYHGPRIYEAKIKEVRTVVCESGAKEPNYFVHYANWNKSWDEWVPESRVLKYNDANLQKQKELIATEKSRSGTKRKKAEPVDRTKRKRGEKEDGVEGEDEHLSRPEVRIVIPDELKQKLVEDWDQIIHKNKLVKLPRENTVTKILADYLASAKGRSARSEQVATELVAGLKVYFEEALGTILLYKFERPQYLQLREEDDTTSVCDIYGPEHLLRLFTKLPSLLAHTQIEERGMTQLVHSLHDFLKHFERRAAALFTEDYDTPSAAYVKSVPL